MNRAPSSWYYCQAIFDSNEVIVDERFVGPMELSQLASLVRSGQLPDDVLISQEKEKWERAYSVPDFLLTLLLDRDRIFREYIVYGETPAGEKVQWGWASDRMYETIAGAPDTAWEIVIRLIDLAPSERSLGYFAAGPLEDLLSEHGPHLIARVEERARENPKFLRALQALWRLSMTDDVWTRVQRAAGRTAPDAI